MSARARVTSPPLFASRRATSSTSGEPATPAPGFCTTKKLRRMLCALIGADPRRQTATSLYIPSPATQERKLREATHGEHQAVRTRLRKLDARRAGARDGREGPRPQAREDGGEPLRFPARYLLALGRNHPRCLPGLGA